MSDIDWKARFAALCELDGDDWDAEHERIEAEWLPAYREAFVSIAVARGWSRENAETWPDQIDREAYVECYRHDGCPRRTAEADVIACEEEAL
jgi:hypothetical protein